MQRFVSGVPRALPTAHLGRKLGPACSDLQHIAMRYLFSVASLVLAATTFAAGSLVPPPRLDLPKQSGLQTAVFAGGCFWGVELVFEHVKGVKDVRSGYSGGKGYMAHYAVVASGTSGHAESVEVLYDPQEISYGQLLRVFFSVAHDPTQLNAQGPDVGPQYRSTIFVANADEERTARAYISQLNASGVFGSPIVTTLEPLQAFYAAEPEHQDYATRRPRDPYIVLNDWPKVRALQQRLPELFVARQ